MYSILISVGAAVAVTCGIALALLPGSWGLGIFLGIVVMLALWILLARRLRKTIQPAFMQVQRQAEAGHLQAAMESLEAMIPLGKWMPMLTGQIHGQIGMFAYHDGNQEKAVRHLAKASKRQSDAQMLLASIHFKADRFDAATKVMSKAIAYNRKNLLLYHVLAWMQQKRGDTPAAMAALGLYLKKKKEDPTTSASLLRLQNGQKLDMAQFGMQWFALGFETPPQSMGQLQQARKGFRQAPKSPGKRKKKQKGKGRR